MKPVLVLGEEPRIVVNIARSLHRRGVIVDVGTLSSDAPLLRSRAIRQCLSLPDPRHDAAFSLAVLMHHIESEGYDLLIPASDTALALMADHHAQLSARLYVACPSADIVQRVLNKARTVQIAQQCGVPVPRSMTLATLDALEEFGSTLTFPVIAKPVGKGHHVTASFKVRRFDTYEALRQAYTSDSKFGRQNLIQEYCPGEGVGVEVLMANRHPIALFQHRRLKEFPRSGGVSVVAIAEPVDSLLADHAMRLLKALEWEGVAMVEFRVDRPTQRVALMEVNGRYWGSLQLSILAGVDFPWYQWQVAHAQSSDVPVCYRTGVTARWTHGALQRLSTRREESSRLARAVGFGREVLSFVRDCLPPTRDLLWSIRDPQPGLSETLRFARVATSAAAERLVLPLIPPSWLSLHRRSRVLDRRSRRVFLLLAMARALGFRQPRVPEHLGNVRTILFVCHGNILRSPMAAALLRQSLSTSRVEMEIRSAGLHATPMNRADRRGMTAATEFGVSLADHRAEPITWEMVRRADAIFVMDQFNEADLLARYPQARTKLFCLGACRPIRRATVDIDDPYNGDLDDVRRCYEIIRCCLDRLIGALPCDTGHTTSDGRELPTTADTTSSPQPMQAQHVRL